MLVTAQIREVKSFTLVVGRSASVAASFVFGHVTVQFSSVQFLSHV